MEDQEQLADDSVRSTETSAVPESPTTGNPRNRALVIGGLVLVVVVGVALFVHNNSRPNATKDIIGTWYFGESGSTEYTFTFHEDGTWDADMTNPISSDHETGTWRSCIASVGCAVYWDNREPEDVYDLVMLRDGDYFYEFWAPGLTGERMWVGEYEMQRV